MIELKNVQKAFGRNQVLRGVNFRVEHGDVVVVLGPSGSGKTTLLRCINFLEKAEEGSLRINNQEVNFKSASRKQILDIRKQTAFVFQNYNLFQNKTALENVTEGLITGRKVPKKEAEERGREALKKVGLTEKENYYPQQLSGGQQQRVGIARAIVLNPEVILFDEPTSALDPELVGETLKLIRKIAAEGITMIVVTHEIAFASDVANKVVFMDDGMVVEEGHPKDIFTDPKEDRTRQFLKRILPENNYSI
jgi:L-cystine transport system ATP-binding protein